MVIFMKNRIIYIVLIFITSVLTACGAGTKWQMPILSIEDAHPNPATKIEFSADSKRMATGGYSGEIYIWSVPEGKRLLAIKGHKKFVSGLYWVNADTLISTAYDGKILVWDIKKGVVIRQQKSIRIHSLAFMPKLGRLFTAHKDGYIRAWQYPSLKLISKQQMGASVRTVTVSHHERWVAAASIKSRVALYTPDLKHLRDMQTARKDAKELHFSPDDKQLASGTFRELYFWDVDSGKLTIRKTEHVGDIVSIDYSPDGKQLVTLGRYFDAYIRLYDAKTMRVERRLLQHRLCGYAIRISPNGKYIGSTSDDDSVRLYDISIPYRPVKPLLY